MRSKIYNAPEVSLLETEEDIITTSEVEVGVETPPTEVGGGSWETI